jgi:hypothetical protein
LDLPEPETNGARRVSAAFAWLAEHEFVRVIPHPGGPATIYLNDERGNGERYELPATALKVKMERGEEPSRDDYWVPLPATFWTNGWIGVLPCAAIAMLLVMLDESAGAGRTTNLWHSPRQASERFALSQDTRTDGLLELEAYGIIDKKRSSITPGVFDYRRMRNVYALHAEQLDVAPGERRPHQVKSPQQFDNLLASATAGDFESL